MTNELTQDQKEFIKKISWFSHDIAKWAEEKINKGASIRYLNTEIRKAIRDIEVEISKK